jgi:NosR/NirI family transcriptional regulator, nitrous oxide reductase regulator
MQMRFQTGKSLLLLLMVLGWVCLLALPVFAEQRFPPPEFESGHQLPETTTPAARAIGLEYLDVVVLAGALAAALWLIHKKRSRKGIIALSFFSLVYFGFWRYGCICAIGSPQNVAYGLFGSGYAIPLGVIAFFALPLVVALFAGRAFCAGVCPHGALQDLVLIKPLKVPAWLEHGLGVFPFIYLGAAVLFAATGSAFLICQYDPFVPVFRMSGRTLMVVAGVGLLVLGMFVGRPYCRFLCPYGALLKMCSGVTRWRVRVTPDRCTQCRLCESSCPFGAMREPETARPGARELSVDRRRLALLLVVVPLLVAGFGLLGWKFSNAAALLHPDVALAERFVREQDTPPKLGVLNPEDLAVERARQNPDELLQKAVQIRKRFELGTTLFGIWIGLVIGAKLVSLSLRRNRTDYEPDQGACLACARCFEFCPDELIRRGLTPPAALEAQTKPGESEKVVLRS